MPAKTPTQAPAPRPGRPPEKLHFISGLPRSGSTLLSAVLKQNPRFHAGMTSPLGDMVATLVAEMSGKNDFSVVISDAQRAAILRGVFQNFYGGFLGTEVVFDTGRIWCSKLPMLAALFPNSKVIACVREMPWVLDSVERLVRRQPLNANKIFHFNPNGTVYSRAEALIDVNGMVGFSFQATKDAFYGQHAPGHLLLLTYESLTRDPRAAMQAVYKFIGEPWFEHDFEHIEYNADEFDARLGLPGLHTVHSKVSAPKRETVLPPDLFNRFAKDSFWLDPANNIRKVPIV
ncbi:MAG: sulfotransferase [Rhodanobacteraceae bacterium]|nr:MAG: sulfotransferase [Rhodanobacteraceae bacterium]